MVNRAKKFRVKYSFAMLICLSGTVLSLLALFLSALTFVGLLGLLLQVCALILSYYYREFEESGVSEQTILPWLIGIATIYQGWGFFLSFLNPAEFWWLESNLASRNLALFSSGVAICSLLVGFILGGRFKIFSKDKKTPKSRKVNNILGLFVLATTVVIVTAAININAGVLFNRGTSRVQSNLNIYQLTLLLMWSSIPIVFYLGFRLNSFLRKKVLTNVTMFFVGIIAFISGSRQQMVSLLVAITIVYLRMYDTQLELTKIMAIVIILLIIFYGVNVLRSVYYSYREVSPYESNPVLTIIQTVKLTSPSEMLVEAWSRSVKDLEDRFNGLNVLAAVFEQNVTRGGRSTLRGILTALPELLFPNKHKITGGLSSLSKSLNAKKDIQNNWINLQIADWGILGSIVSFIFAGWILGTLENNLTRSENFWSGVFYVVFLSRVFLFEGRMYQSILLAFRDGLMGTFLVWIIYRCFLRRRSWKIF